jgi:hypothetical protein
MRDKEQYLKQISTKQLKCKSNTKVELGMKPYETMATYTKFVKKNKLVIFIDKETEDLINFKKLINKFNFNGTVKYYRTT